MNWKKLEKILEFRPALDKDGKSQYPKQLDKNIQYTSSIGVSENLYLIYIGGMYTQFEIHAKEGPMMTLRRILEKNPKQHAEFIRLVEDFLKVQEGEFGLGLINDSPHLREYTKKVLDRDE